MLEASFFTNPNMNSLTGFLASGGDSNARNSAGVPLIAVAARENMLPCVEILIAHGADVDAVDEDGNSALSIPTSAEITNVLVTSGADIDIINYQGRSPLFLAAVTSRADIANILVELGADVGLCDSGGNSPIEAASFAGAVDIVSTLFEAGADISESAVKFSILKGGIDTVSFYVENSPNILRGFDHGLLAAAAISTDNDLELIKVLSRIGLDFNQSCFIDDGSLVTPLSAAITKHSESATSVVKFLLENGANPNFSGGMENSPIILAFTTGPDVFDLLLEFGAEPNTTFSDGTSLLNVALKFNAELAAKLLVYGAKINSDIRNEIFLQEFGSSVDDRNPVTTFLSSLLIALSALEDKEMLSNEETFGLLHQVASNDGPSIGSYLSVLNRSNNCELTRRGFQWFFQAVEDGLLEEVVNLIGLCSAGIDNTEKAFHAARQRCRSKIAQMVAKDLGIFDDDPLALGFGGLVLSRLPYDCIAQESRRCLTNAKKSKSISGMEFELSCMDRFEQLGWLVKLTAVTGDQGADLLLKKGRTQCVVQCKDHGVPVGNSAVQEVYSAKAYYGAVHAIVVSSSGYTRSARDLAERTSVILLTADNLDYINRACLN